ncbi:unnamed protein product [Blepharisma stoltei]|uniref:Nop domain-containing protein n=1 Tax=Blepharisma stoltei TaxID=1481888 RepID=A0AAU9K417_9CILI|nr:unnamed protein product [Blepharisma stoltei]
MESTIAEDFLNDLDELSEEDSNLKQQKLDEDTNEEIPILEDSIILKQNDLSNHLSQISSQNPQIFDYKLVMKSNDFILQIDQEILQLHKYLRDLYFPHFSELEELIQNPIDFSRTLIKFIEENSTSAEISSIVPNHIIIAIAMAVAHDPPKPIPIEKQKIILKVSSQILQLNEARNTIQDYIEERMTKIAPSLTFLLGSSVAGKLIAAVGGLEKLAVMPACNIQVLGIENKNALGLSALGSGKHKGFLAQTETAISAGRLQKKAIRMLAAKTALAARYDLFNKNNDGSHGKSLLENINDRLEKAIEPPPSHKRQPLPVPKDIKKPHRGGKRIRAAKRKYELTEMRKLASRVQFGTEEQEEFRETGHTFGSLGKSGKLLIKPASHQKYKLSSKRQEQLNQQASGLTSCYAFSSQAELKLDNPSASLISPVPNKLFDSKSGFSTVIAEKSEKDKN